MKHIYRAFLFFSVSLTICVCSACSDDQKITEEQAIQIVKNKFEDNQFGSIEIQSVILKDGYFEIIWTRDSNCEGGTVKVDVETGKTESEHHIC